MKTLAYGIIGSMLMIGSANAAIVSATNSVDGAFDASLGTRMVTFAESGSINDINVQIKFAKCDGQNLETEDGACDAGGTPFYNEIIFTLTAPDGSTSTVLINGGQFASGTGPGGHFDILFDDEAAALPGSTPASGSFQPFGSLAVFDGLGINGTWTLLIQDTVGLDALSFFEYTIFADIGDVPEPGMLGLFGLGVLALAGARRRKA